MIAGNEGKAGAKVSARESRETFLGIKNLPHNRPRRKKKNNSSCSRPIFFVVPPKTPEKIETSHGIPLVRGWVAPTVWDAALKSLIDRSC